jgi:hypothetical protein
MKKSIPRKTSHVEKEKEKRKTKEAIAVPVSIRSEKKLVHLA